MRLTDLRAELDRQADQIDGVGDLPLRAIRRKAAHIRGRRIATVALAVGLVAALPPALNGVTTRTQAPTVGTSQTPTPTLDDIIGQPQPQPSITTRPNPRDVVKDGLRFPFRIGGDLLLKATVGNAGQRRVGLELTVPPGETEIRPLCLLPSHLGPDPRYRLEVFVNGTLDHRSRCNSDQVTEAIQQRVDYQVRGGQAGVNAARMTAGKRVVVSARLTYAGSETVSQLARIGVGVYRLGALQVVDRTGNGLRLPKGITYGGTTYYLDLSRVGRAIDGARLTVRTPTNGAPFLILSGASRHRPDSTQPQAGWRTIRLTGVGLPGTRSGTRLPGLAYKLIPARPSGTAVATYSGPKEPDFIHVLAVYKPAR